MLGWLADPLPPKLFRPHSLQPTLDGFFYGWAAVTTSRVRGRLGPYLRRRPKDLNASLVARARAKPA
jgi:hypothetical protein